jgi:hypothetical protein
MSCVVVLRMILSENGTHFSGSGAGWLKSRGMLMADTAAVKAPR